MKTLSEKVKESWKDSMKKGIPLSQAFGAILAVVVVGVLVIVAIYLYNSLGASFTAGTAAANASNTMITQFATYPALVGLVGTIVFLGIVIGVLVGSFVFGGRRGA